MKIIRAEKMGFCFGVKNAVDTCYKISKENSKKYILGMIVHNKDVVNDMKSIGFEVIEEENILNNNNSLKEGDTIIIRAHGTTKDIMDILNSKKINIIDTTCVFVKKIKKILIEQEKLGDHIIFIGDKNHPEVRGIISFGKNVVVFKNLEELKTSNFDYNISYTVLTQTTLNKEKFFKIKNFLEKKYKNMKIFDKICGATSERQEATKNLAKIADIVLVIGDEKSSNSKKLLEIAKTYNNNSFLIQNEKELSLELLKNIEIVGITAGASTPEKIIKNIENKIRGNFDV